MPDIFDFCVMTRRKLSSDQGYESLIKDVYGNFLALSDLAQIAPKTALTDNGECRAFHVVGHWNGVVVDRSYLSSLVDILYALLEGENCTDLARPVLKIVCAEFAALLPTEALMLRHEPLSDLYAIENAPVSIEALVECEMFEEVVTRLRGTSHSELRREALAYVILHEVGHWIYRSHSHHGAIARNTAEIRKILDELRSLPVDKRLKEVAAKRSILDSVFGADEVSETLVEEVFCDRFTCGVFFARAASDGDRWENTFVKLRLVQESMRVLHRAKAIARDFCGPRGFLATSPKLEVDVVERGFSAMHARGYISSFNLASSVPTIYKEYSDGTLPEIDIELLGRWAETLLRQSLIVFTIVAGPSMERCVYLILRTVKVKAEDPEIYAFFDRLRKRYQITEDDDIKCAFDRVVEDASRRALGC